MRVTKELLKRYGQGLCTEQEKKEIEKWFDTLDDPSLRLGKSIRPTPDPELIWYKIHQEVPKLKRTLNFRRASNIVLLNNFARYAAAACFALLMFFGGRLTAPSAVAKDTPKDPTAGHLFIAGLNEAKVNLPGDIFRVGFDGTIKLYNNSMVSKTIQVGDTSLILDPYQSYLLSGTTQQPKLIGNNDQISGITEHIELDGDFSVLLIDNK